LLFKIFPENLKKIKKLCSSTNDISNTNIIKSIHALITDKLKTSEDLGEKVINCLNLTCLIIT